MFAVVRYVADPIRQEPLNVGIVIWAGPLADAVIDPDAVARVIHDNPGAHPDSILRLQPALRQTLGLNHSADPEEVVRRLREAFPFPVMIGEPRQTSVDLEDSAAIRRGLERLVMRMVQPRRRAADPKLGALHVLQQRIQPLLQSALVEQNHVFDRTRTGLPRRVDFLAVGERSVAVDALRFDLRRADEIRLVADAEAHKLVDIIAHNELHIAVFGIFSELEEVQDATSEARVILLDAGVEVVVGVEEAAGILSSASVP